MSQKSTTKKSQCRKNSGKNIHQRSKPEHTPDKPKHTKITKWKNIHQEKIKHAPESAKTYTGAENKSRTDYK